jgi:hypothetical protein
VVVLSIVGLMAPAASAASVHQPATVKVFCPDFVWFCYIAHHHKAPPLEPWIR